MTEYLFLRPNRKRQYIHTDLPLLSCSVCSITVKVAWKEEEEQEERGGEEEGVKACIER